MQNTNGDVRSFLSDALALVKAPTHDPQAQLMIEDGIDRSVRHCMEPLQRLVGVEGYTRGIAQQQQEKNVGIWRQRRDPLLHLIEGEIAVVGEVYPACEWLGCLLKGLLPICSSGVAPTMTAIFFVAGATCSMSSSNPGRSISWPT